MITISKPKPEDAGVIHNVMKTSWYVTYVNNEIGITKEDYDATYSAEVEEKQIQTLRYRAENPKDTDISFVAKIEEKVVGFIRLKINNDHTDLISLYIHPEHIGEGIGTKLWDTAHKTLPNNTDIILEVVANTKAVEFYKKIGFVTTGETYFEKEAMPVSGVHLSLIKMIYKK